MSAFCVFKRGFSPENGTHPARVPTGTIGASAARVQHPQRNLKHACSGVTHVSARHSHCPVPGRCGTQPAGRVTSTGAPPARRADTVMLPVTKCVGDNVMRTVMRPIRRAITTDRPSTRPLDDRATTTMRPVRRAITVPGLISWSAARPRSADATCNTSTMQCHRARIGVFERHAALAPCHALSRAKGANVKYVA